MQRAAEHDACPRWPTGTSSTSRLRREPYRNPAASVDAACRVPIGHLLPLDRAERIARHDYDRQACRTSEQCRPRTLRDDPRWLRSSRWGLPHLAPVPRCRALAADLVRASFSRLFPGFRGWRRRRPPAIAEAVSAVDLNSGAAARRYNTSFFPVSVISPRCERQTFLSFQGSRHRDLRLKKAKCSARGRNGGIDGPAARSRRRRRRRSRMGGTNLRPAAECNGRGPSVSSARC
jgi:hypothetical protein